MSEENTAPELVTLDDFRNHWSESYPYLKEVDYRTLTSLGQVEEYLASVPQGKMLVLDYETTSLNPRSGEIVGVALSDRARSGVYIPTAHNVRPELNVPWGKLRGLLTEAYRERVFGCFNYKFEKNWSEVHGLDFTDYADVQVAIYLHDINARGGLKEKTAQFLKIAPIDFSTMVDKKALASGKMSFADVNPYAATLYAAGDGDFTYRLWDLSQEALQEQPLIWTIDNRLVEVIRVMENNHIKVDKAVLLSYRDQLIDQVERVRRRVFAMVGNEFDISSPPQVGEVLYGQLGLKPVKTTKGGKPSTDVESLEKLEKLHPVAWEIGRYRRTSKSLTTFVDNFVRGLSPEGEARFSIMSTRAVTGRLAAGGSESEEEAPTYAETGYTEINAQAITATKKIKKVKAKWYIQEFTREFLSECEAVYLQERLQRHYREWLVIERSRKEKEELTTARFKEWKASFTDPNGLELWIDSHGLRASVLETKKKTLPIRGWRQVLLKEWEDSSSKEEWKKGFYEPHKAKVLNEYRNSPSKVGCVYADPIGWGACRKKEFVCSQEVCSCLEKGKAVGRKFEAEDKKVVDLKELPPIRMALIARPGYKHVAIDYSGVEYRIAGNLSQEPVWIAEFCDNLDPDPHSATSRSIYDLPASVTPTSVQRDRGKTTNFTIMFGGSGYTVAANIGDGMTPEEGDAIVKKFFSGLSKLHAFIQQTHQEAKIGGVVKTRFNRRRFFRVAPDLDFKSKRRALAKIERDSFSTKVQGTAADIMRLSMVKVHTIIKARKWEDVCRILLTIHDELLFEIREDMLGEVIPVLVEAMTKHNIPEWKIPLDCDIEIGDSWGDGVEHKFRFGKLISSDEWKKYVKSQKEASPEPEKVDLPEEDEVAYLLNFDLTPENLERFKKILTRAQGTATIKLMFQGIAEELLLDEKVTPAVLESFLKEEGLQVLKR